MYNMFKLFEMRILVFFAAMMLIVSSYAQQLSAETIEMCSNDVKASVENMKNSSEGWNQGAEPFSKFIEKFSTDEQFMNTRIKLTVAQKNEYKELLVPSNFEAKLPAIRQEGEEMYYQQWGEMQTNTVYLDCGWVDSYYTHTFEFKRIGGKWNLSKIVPGE